MQEFEVEGIKLIELFEIDDEKYTKVKVCKTEKFEEDVYVINGNEIIKDKEQIKRIEQENALELPEEDRNIIY